MSAYTSDWAIHPTAFSPRPGILIRVHTVTAPVGAARVTFWITDHGTAAYWGEVEPDYELMAAIVSELDARFKTQSN